jgi:hypothetical protein
LAIGIAATQTITEEKWEIILSTFTLFLLLGVVLEIAFGRDAWWSLLNLDKLESIKGPYSTTTDFFGFTVLRLRTFVGEPINTSYMFGALAAWHFYKRKIAMALILSVTLFFTFAKSGIILLLMSLAWYHLCTKKRIKKVKLMIKMHREIKFIKRILVNNRIGYFQINHKNLELKQLPECKSQNIFLYCL